MLRAFANIVITQRPTDALPGRTKVFSVPVVSSVTIESSWASFTDTAKVIFPKNIYVRDKNNKMVPWQNVTIIAGLDPVMVRGDKISIELGYRFYDEFKKEIEVKNIVFDGFITGVINRTPVEVMCEDYMYLLKLKRVVNKVWKPSQYNLETMLKEMVEGTGITVKTDNITTTIGEIRTQNATVADVLNQIRKDYKFESYIRGTELRCGILKYYTEDRLTHTFHFQKNIVSDRLEYTREDDLRIKLIAYSVEEFELTTTNSAGKKKKSTKRLQVEVGDSDGGVRTAYFPNVATVAELKEQAEAFYRKIKVEGFKGQFVSFGIPAVKHGDVVKLENDIITEQSGSYIVKSVETKFAVADGFRQEITPDYRVDVMNEIERNGQL